MSIGTWMPFPLHGWPPLVSTASAWEPLQVTEEDVLAELGQLPEWFTAEDKEDDEGQSHFKELGLDEASARALQQMMGGQLKSKKDMSALEMTVEK